jgi:hypothetical protein
MSAFNQYTVSGSTTITSAFDATSMDSGGVSSSSSSVVHVAHDHDREHEPECYVQLLTAGYWPSSPSVDTLCMPKELLMLQERYTSFYCSKFQGRRLQWAHAHQRCVLTARFPKGKKELEVCTYM